MTNLNRKNNVNITMHSITFFYPDFRPKVSSNLRDMEELYNNIVFAPAIGTLVGHYSDQRPTPYLAKTWYNEGNRWIFELREGLFCENGEAITAENFSRSLARTIRMYSEGGPHPVFKNLKSYNELIDQKLEKFDGIYAEGNKLIFEFVNNHFSGFLNHLAMAPFGYICAENFDGYKWKDNEKIISSGAFTVSPIQTHGTYELIARRGFVKEFDPKFDRIIIKKGTYEDYLSHKGPKVIELLDPLDNQLKSFPYIRKMPQTLWVLILNYHQPPFSDLNFRRKFLEEYRKQQSEFNLESKGYTKTERFYFNDNVSLKANLYDQNKSSTHKKIETKIGPSPFQNTMLKLTNKTVSSFGGELIFKSHNPNEDPGEPEWKKNNLIAMFAEIGGGFESWIIDMLFCSDVGWRWPDPSGRICELTQKVHRGEVSVVEAAQLFQDYLIEDAALIPAFHRGGYYLLSDDIDIKSLGPMVTRIRFEEVGLKND